jgi:acylphosphatase
MTVPGRIARRYRVYGAVQGVGFRYFVQRAARHAGLTGWVRNLPDGTVEALAVGTADQIAALRSQLELGPVRAAVERVDEEEADPTPAAGLRSFEIAR